MDRGGARKKVRWYKLSPGGQGSSSPAAVRSSQPSRRDQRRLTASSLAPAGEVHCVAPFPRRSHFCLSCLRTHSLTWIFLPRHRTNARPQTCELLAILCVAFTTAIACSQPRSSSCNTSDFGQGLATPVLARRGNQSLGLGRGVCSSDRTGVLHDRSTHAADVQICLYPRSQPQQRGSCRTHPSAFVSVISIRDRLCSLSCRCLCELSRGYLRRNLTCKSIYTTRPHPHPLLYLDPENTSGP